METCLFVCSPPPGSIVHEGGEGGRGGVTHSRDRLDRGMGADGGHIKKAKQWQYNSRKI